MHLQSANDDRTLIRFDPQAVARLGDRGIRHRR
jgi:hypothetical protein